jgi:uncharacterized membrane protein
MSFSSKSLITDKPLVVKPPYSANARRAGRFAGAAFLLNIGFNLLWPVLRLPDIGTLVALAVAERVVILTLAAFAVVYAVRALRELGQPGSNMKGRGEAIASLVIATLAVVGTVLTVGELIRLLG